MRVADILTRKGGHVSTIGHHQSLDDAISVMHRERIGAIVIANANTGAPMGLISQGEILAALNGLGSSALRHCATGIMRRPAPHCFGSSTIREAMSQMTRERTRHLLVLGKEGALQGIVSMGDLVAARVGAAELEANVLRDMARSHLLAGSP